MIPKTSEKETAKSAGKVFADGFAPLEKALRERAFKALEVKYNKSSYGEPSQKERLYDDWKDELGRLGYFNGIGDFDYLREFPTFSALLNELKLNIETVKANRLEAGKIELPLHHDRRDIPNYQSFDQHERLESTLGKMLEMGGMLWHMARGDIDVKLNEMYNSSGKNPVVWSILKSVRDEFLLTEMKNCINEKRIEALKRKEEAGVK